jgi:hypothetical protein
MIVESTSLIEALGFADNMSRHMRTTVRLDDALLNRAKREAAKRNQTLTSMIDAGLRLVLAQAETQRRSQRVVLPVSRAGGGVLPGVDLNNSAALLDAIEEQH